MRLLIASLSLAALVGCSYRPDPSAYTVRVESTKPGTEYRLNGNVDLDGTTTEVKDQTTPWRFTGTGLALRARVTSSDPDCHLKAVVKGYGERELLRGDHRVHQRRQRLGHAARGHAAAGSGSRGCALIPQIIYRRRGEEESFKARVRNPGRTSFRCRDSSSPLLL